MKLPATYASLLTALTLVVASLSCSQSDAPDSTDQIVDYCWLYAQNHPDGFTLRLTDMSAPAEGIVVSYAATQNSFGKDGLRRAVVHALAHNKIVGGWLNPDNRLYYFDSDTIFEESALSDAIEWARKNNQHSVYILSTDQTIEVD
ncbi:MAG: hypothetical protein PUE54_04260 [Bacteroidales bacterium]|nr:hypothetical protein [Bacteroidales bacterium]